MQIIIIFFKKFTYKISSCVRVFGQKNCHYSSGIQITWWSSDFSVPSSKNFQLLKYFGLWPNTCKMMTIPLESTVADFLYLEFSTIIVSSLACCHLDILFNFTHWSDTSMAILMLSQFHITSWLQTGFEYAMPSKWRAGNYPHFPLRCHLIKVTQTFYYLGQRGYVVIRVGLSVHRIT